MSPVSATSFVFRLRFWVFFGLVVLPSGSVGWGAAEEPRAALARAEQLEKDKHYAEAVAVYDSLLQAHPFEAGLYSRRGWARHLAGDEAGALADLGIAATFQSDNVNILARRGWVHVAVKDWPAAIEDFRACARLEPSMARWHYELAQCLARAGKPDEALREIDQAISIDPASGTFLVIRATLHEKLGNRDEGLADCARALALLKNEKSIASVKALQARLAGAAHQPAGSLLPGGRPGRSGPIQVERDDRIEGDAVSPPGVEPLARPSPSPAALDSAGPAQRPVSAAPASAGSQLLEGIWQGEGIGTWTFQILRELGGGVALVHAGDGGRGLLESQPQSDIWVFIQGDENDGPDNCRYWRLERRHGQLLTRRYEPHPSGRWFDVGTFTTFVSTFVGPSGARESYDPADDTDAMGKPVNWLHLYHQRIEAKAGEMAVLRRGGLEPAKEQSRRREWAAARAAREVGDVIERMAAEEDKPEEAIEREKAQGRAFVRRLNEQFYLFGSEPPGFENDADASAFGLAGSGGVEPSERADFATRRRREWILLWNVWQNLELKVLQEERYQRGLHGMRPEQREQGVANLEMSIVAQEKRLAELRAAMAGSEPGKWTFEAARREMPAIEGDIADSRNRIRCLQAEITRRANPDAPGGYEEIPLARVLAEARRSVTAAFDLPGCMRGIASRLDRELPSTAGKASAPAVPSDAAVIPAECQIELPDEWQALPGS